MTSYSQTEHPIGQMLADINLETYRSLFQTLGYKTVSDCAQLNHERLQEMGISLTGHRKRILRKIQEFLEMERLPPEHSSAEVTGASMLLKNEDNITMVAKTSHSLSQESNTTLISPSVNCWPSGQTGDAVSMQLKQVDPERPSGNSGDYNDILLGNREHRDSGNSDFFEFQGPMVENDLYGEMNNDHMKKTKNKKFPTRSFILRNRPVPDLPVSVTETSFKSYAKEVSTMDNCPEGNFTCNLQNQQSGDENIHPISPYEETFFFRASECTEEASGDKFSVSSNSDLNEGTGINASPEHNSPCKTSSMQGHTEESVYSSLEECTLRLGGTATVDKRRQSLPDARLLKDNISHHEVETLVQEIDPLSQEDYSITPYACFYGPYTMLNKAGWLDKLSPHSSCMFQKRWVKIDGHHVSYYQSDRDVFAKGKILLSAITKTKKLGENKFEVVTSQRTFVFRAEKEGHRHEWISTLERVLETQAKNCPVLCVGDKSGYLEIRGYKNKIYTVINGSKLWLSKSKQDYNAGITITDITMTMITLKNIDRRCFEITTPFRNFCFTAESEREKQEWIEELQQSIAETVADYEVAEKIWFNESNKSCADCRAPNPDWASINLGVVICRNCAGQHRTLGSKVSKVHSLKLDTEIWSDKLIEVFIVLGNEKVNSFWEANLLPENMLPVTSTINQRRLFVTQKYKEGRFKKILSPDPTPQQLNEALCTAVTKPDVLETMILVFSGANIMCATGDPIHSTPYLLAKMAGQSLQMEFLHNNRLSDYKTSDYLAKTGSNQSMFYCGYLYKALSSSSKMSAYQKIKEEMKKWWCTIDSSLLSYYEDESDSVPEGCIDLSESLCLVVHPSDFNLNSRAISTFEIFLLSERMFLFGAENAESQREWAKAISKNFVPNVEEKLTELEFDVIGYLHYKDSYSLMDWKEGWFALEKSRLHYSNAQENILGDVIELKKLQELTRSSSVINGEKKNVVLLVENGRTLYIHGHTIQDFMVWHCAIEKAASTDGNALQDQQLCKNNIPIIVHSCMAFVTQYGLGSKSLYLKNGDPLKVRELLEDFKKDARSIKLKVGKHHLEDVTDVLKCFLYEIDDALLTKELYPYWISALDIQDEQERVVKYKTLIDTLPTLQKATLAALIEHLYRIQKCSDVNYLDTHILAKAFASHLFQTKGQRDTEVHVVEELIRHYAEIFDVSEEQLQQMDIENRFITKWNDVQIQSPQSGDLLLEVFMERKDPDTSVIIRVSPRMVAAELTICVAGIRNITLPKDMFWTTFEVLENGEIERPMHYNERVLATVLEWSMLRDPGNAYLLVKPFPASNHLLSLGRYTSLQMQSGNMKYKEDSSKLLSGNKFQERYFVLRERKLLIYKDIKSIKPEKVLPVVPCKLYIGVKKKMKPPTSFGLTVCFEKHQWYLCCKTEEAQMEWLISILNAQSEKTRRKMKHTASREELSNAVQQRMSMMVDVFSYKEEERLSNQKKHYSLVDLDSPENYSRDTSEIHTMDVNRLHNPTDQMNKELSSNTQLPQNVIKELNLVILKSRKDRIQ
ncbi:arf-GAP with Rho-GAP domain, ANK repeat and PH domain-containing protein 2 isoform X2 [Pseudophryne corroboree]|uniref:arf-GAP with Rho-GAP domain, ANK repeat and PH domain-containing protein 2 isoform X2 n=1 Tax=Pseudophryne corroboree TaxID=495146 RepID=UPI0030813547